MAKFQFSNVVVVDDDQVGVIVKSWDGRKGYNHDVYVRGYNGVKNYEEAEIKHFIYSKTLLPDECEFYS
jgi:hypothetical protein